MHPEIPRPEVMRPIITLSTSRIKIQKQTGKLYGRMSGRICKKLGYSSIHSSADKTMLYQIYTIY